MRTSEPVRATRKPGPLASSKSRTVMRKFRGRPRLAALSEREFWVLAMQTGRFPKPFLVKRSSLARAVSVRSAPSPP